MLDKMKLKLIKFIDWVDDTILHHRFYWICNIISNSSWWGELVEIQLSEQDFIRLATIAHERDITFNQLCVDLLKEYIKDNENNK